MRPIPSAALALLLLAGTSVSAALARGPSERAADTPARADAARRTLARVAPVVNTAPHHSGYVNTALGSTTLVYQTPTYVSADKPRSFGLFYASGQAAPTAFVQVDATDNSGADAPARMSLRLRNVSSGVYETLSHGAQEVFFSAGAGTTRLAAHFAASHLATGAHAYDAVVTSYWADGSSLQAAPARIRVLVVNERNSVYGAGWSVPGIQRLYVQSDGIFLTEGDGTGKWFPRSPQCTTPTQSWCHYLSPAGDFTRLTYDSRGNNYQRHYLDNTVIKFTATGRMTSSSPQNGVGWAQSVVNYDASGRVSSLVDWVGKAITVGYSAAGKLATLTDPTGRVVNVTVGAAGTLDAICDPLGCPVSAGYDGSYRMTWRSDRATSRWDFAYDALGGLRSTTAPSVDVYGVGAVRPVEETHSLAAAVFPAAGAGTSVAPAARVLPGAARARVIGPRGDTTRLELNRFGHPVRLEAPGGQVTVIERDTASRPVRLTKPTGDVTEYTYTGAYPATVRDVTNNRTTTFTWTPYIGYPDASYPVGTYPGYPLVISTPGEPEVERDAFGSVTYTTRDGPSRWWIDEGDNFHRPTLMYGPGGHTRYFYAASGSRNQDSVWQVSGTDTLATRTERDAVGRVIRQTAPDGSVTRFAYDALNRVTRVATAVDSVRYTYTAAGQLQTATDGKGQTQTFAYNALGWTVSRTDARGGITRNGYDVAGNMVAVTNRRNQTVGYEYDLLGRVTKQTSHEGAVTTYAYDPAGLWTAVANPEGTDTLRAVRGAQPTVSQVMVRGGRRYALHMQGDTVARTLTQTGDWGWGVRYTFAPDHSGRLTELRDLMVGVNTTVDRDTAQNVVNTLLPTGFNLTRGSYSFSYADPASGGALDVNFSRNVLNGRFGQYNYVDQKYDGGGQLVEQGGIIDWTFQYKILDAFAWDSAGNPRHASASVGAGNRLDAFNGFALTYDADGNLVRRVKAGVADQTLTWNSLGQLARVVSPGMDVTYGYDGQGRRVRKTVNGVTTRYLHDGQHVVAEVDATGNVLRQYTYYPGVDRPHSLRTGGVTYYYVTDPRGNVSGLVRPGAGVVNRYDYTAFGVATTVTEAVANPLRYGGREYDAETGLYYLRNRYYDPALQRFASEDPLGALGADNAYEYAGNDPMSRGDPTGLCPPGFPVGYGYAENQHGQMVPWDPCGDDEEDRIPNAQWWARWYFENQWGHDPGTEAAYQAALDYLAQQEAWAQQRAERINRSVGSYNYSQQLSDSEKIILGVKARLEPVQPYLEAYAGFTLSILPLGGFGGAMTTLNLTRSYGVGLYRAVQVAELNQILQSGGRFANPYGIEGKYFSTALNGAAKYGRMAGQRWPQEGAYTLVGTTVDVRLLAREMVTSVDGGIPTVYIPTSLLESLAPATVLNYFPIVF